MQASQGFQGQVHSRQQRKNDRLHCWSVSGGQHGPASVSISYASDEQKPQVKQNNDNTISKCEFRHHKQVNKARGRLRLQPQPAKTKGKALI